MKAMFGKMKSKWSMAFALIAFYLPTTAYAQLSTRTAGISEEASLIVGEVVFWFQVVALFVFLVAVVSFAIDKKNQKPAQWQLTAIVVSAIVMIGPFLLGDLSSTISGERVEIEVRDSRSGF